MRQMRKNQEKPDLRYSYEAKDEVLGGIVYLRDNYVQVWWNSTGPVTYSGASSREASVFYETFKKENA